MGHIGGQRRSHYCSHRAIDWRWQFHGGRLANLLAAIFWGIPSSLGQVSTDRTV